MVRAACSERTTRALVTLEDECNSYQVVSLKDPLAEDDWDGWTDVNTPTRAECPARGGRSLRHELRAAGARDRRGIASAVLLKPNECGTLTSAREAFDRSREAS